MLAGSQATVPGVTRRQAMTVLTATAGETPGPIMGEECMTTWVLLLIAIAAAVVVFAYRAARARNAVDEPEGTEAMAESNEQTANAGIDGQDRATSVLRPLPDAQTGQTDVIRHSVLETAGTDGQERTSVLRQLSDTQTGQAETVQRAVLGTDGQPYAQLLEDHELQRIRLQWKEIQSQFVDEPRQAVQDADALVAELMQRLAEKFASERGQLESQWAGGDDVSTEDLRRGLRQYRSFFERLLAA